jgi:integrase
VAVIELTEARIRHLPLAGGIFWDARVKGLGVKCHKTCRSYICQGDVRRNRRHVRSVRVTIGRCDRIGLAEARRKAKAVMSDIQSGIDPAAAPAESGVTLAEAMDAHLAERPLRPATEHSCRYALDHYLKRLRSRAVADITRADCRELMEALKEKRGATTAGIALRTLKAVVNTAMRMDETIRSNPVNALRIPTAPRRRVAELDLADFWRRTAVLTPVMRDLARATLLTGARRSSILNVRRADVDLERRTITFAHMKTTEDGMTFPIGRWLAEALAARMEDDEPLGSEWLWPSPTSSAGHIVEPKRKGFASPHALRHVARTLMVEAGVPFSEAGLLIGHKLPGLASTYVHAAHLVEHLRPYAQALEDLVLAKASAQVMVLPPA